MALVTFSQRPAPKNQRRSFAIGPPKIPSELLPSALGCTNPFDTSNGVSVLHDGLEKFMRQSPENVLPPLRVTALTTPPVKRPYSALIPEVSVWTS